MLPATDWDEATRSFTAAWEPVNTAAYMVDVYDCQLMADDAPAFAMLTANNDARATEVAAAAGWQECNVQMTGGIKNDIILIQSAANKPFLIKDFTVTQDLEAGDLLVAPVAQKEATECSVAVQNVSEGLIGYDVMAGRQRYERAAVSGYSDTQLVQESSVTIAVAPHAVVAVQGRTLTAMLPQAGAIEVYAADGQLVARAQGAAGFNTVALAAPGVYVARVCGKAYKVAAR